MRPTDLDAVRELAAQHMPAWDPESGEVTALATLANTMADEIEALRSQLAAAKEFKATFSVQALRGEVEALLEVAKAAKAWSDAIDKGFASELRTDIARAAVNRALQKAGM